MRDILFIKSNILKQKRRKNQTARFRSFLFDQGIRRKYCPKCDIFFIEVIEKSMNKTKKTEKRGETRRQMKKPSVFLHSLTVLSNLNRITCSSSKAKRKEKASSKQMAANHEKIIDEQKGPFAHDHRPVD